MNRYTIYDRVLNILEPLLREEIGYTTAKLSGRAAIERDHLFSAVNSLQTILILEEVCRDNSLSKYSKQGVTQNAEKPTYPKFLCFTFGRLLLNKQKGELGDEP